MSEATEIEAQENFSKFSLKQKRLTVTVSQLCLKLDVLGLLTLKQECLNESKAVLRTRNCSRCYKVVSTAISSIEKCPLGKKLI